MPFVLPASQSCYLLLSRTGTAIRKGLIPSHTNSKSDRLTGHAQLRLQNIILDFIAVSSHAILLQRRSCNGSQLLAQALPLLARSEI
ncbi:MAG: hypothetical protein F6J93_12330 [Oscillatoria sp. SIO1A7]|nr:hypothetical protein [Oscillatoria sp. SIO1A7]